MTPRNWNSWYPYIRSTVAFLVYLIMKEDFKTSYFVADEFIRRLEKDLTED